MAKDSQPAKRKRKEGGIKKGNSVNELSFLYAYECLCESTTAADGFLGFTLNLNYVKEHKSRSEELSKLQNFFPLEVLQAVIVWSVQEQKEQVIKWTDREEMNAYLKLHGAK